MWVFGPVDPRYDHCCSQEESKNGQIMEHSKKYRPPMKKKKKNCTVEGIHGRPKIGLYLPSFDLFYTLCSKVDTYVNKQEVLLESK